MSANPFTPEIVTWAQVAQKIYRIPASLSLSAAMLESALGKHTPAGTNNWFGIKDASNSNAASTREQAPDGIWYTIEAGFRRFASPADGFIYYGRLLGLAKPYHDMVTTFLRSKQTPADVQALSHALTSVYASAHSYGDQLVKIQLEYNLYQFDKGAKPMVDITPTTAPVIVAPPPATPSVKQTALNVGDALNILLELADVAAEAGIGSAPSLLPGPLKAVSMFFAPTVIQGYIHSAFLQLETATKDKTITIDTSNAIVAMVVQNIKDNEPRLVAQLGNLEAWVAPLVAKFFNVPAAE